MDNDVSRSSAAKIFAVLCIVTLCRVYYLIQRDYMKRSACERRGA